MLVLEYLLVGAVVILAGLYLFRRLRKEVSGESGCCCPGAAECELAAMLRDKPGCAAWKHCPPDSPARKR